MNSDHLKAAAEKYAREVYGERAKGKSIAHFSVTNTDAYDSYLAGAELMRAENELLKKRVEVLESACKSGVGYEPLAGSLEPRKFSEALVRSSRIAKGEV